MERFTCIDSAVTREHPERHDANLLAETLVDTKLERTERHEPRVLTIAREYGSGRAEIAEFIAKQLGWKVMDQVLLTEISSKAKVPTSEVAAIDEQVDPLVVPHHAPALGLGWRWGFSHRTRQTFRRGTRPPVWLSG